MGCLCVYFFLLEALTKMTHFHHKTSVYMEGCWDRFIEYFYLSVLCSVCDNIWLTFCIFYHCSTGSRSGLMCECDVWQLSKLGRPIHTEMLFAVSETKGWFKCQIEDSAKLTVVLNLTRCWPDCGGELSGCCERGELGVGGGGVQQFEKGWSSWSDLYTVWRFRSCACPFYPNFFLFFSFFKLSFAKYSVCVFVQLQNDVITCISPCHSLSPKPSPMCK